MTMQEWEIENKDKIVRWEADYDHENMEKTVVFTLNDKSTKTFTVPFTQPQSI